MGNQTGKQVKIKNEELRNLFEEVRVRLTASSVPEAIIKSILLRMYELFLQQPETGAIQLLLSDLPLGDLGVRIVMDRIGVKTTISGIELRNTLISSNGLSAVAQRLGQGLPITKLDLSRNGISVEDLRSLVPGLAAAKNLQSLSLSTAQLSDEHVPVLCELVRQCPRLEFFDISNNLIGKRGLSTVIEVMSTHPRLRAVNVNANRGLTADHLMNIDKLTTSHDAVGALVENVLSDVSENEEGGKNRVRNFKKRYDSVKSAHNSPQQQQQQQQQQAQSRTHAASALAPPTAGGMGAGGGAGGSGIGATSSGSKQLQKQQDSVIEARGHRPSNRFTYAFADTVGRRNDMQDVIVCHGRFRDKIDEDFFGVYDGHGGIECAEFVGKYLHPNLNAIVSKMVKSNAASLSNAESLRKAMSDAFRDTASQISKKKVPNGTTAAVVYFSPDYYVVANAGDTRVVLCRAGKAIRLTIDHKPDDPVEEKYIRSMGGFVSTGRINGMLAVSRAFGDLFLQPFVRPDPHIHVDRINPDDEFMILACDGVFDVLTDQAAVDVVRKASGPSDGATLLKDTAYHRGSTDNISIIVISFVQGQYPTYYDLTHNKNTLKGMDLKAMGAYSAHKPSSGSKDKGGRKAPPGRSRRKSFAGGENLSSSDDDSSRGRRNGPMNARSPNISSLSLEIPNMMMPAHHSPRGGTKKSMFPSMPVSGGPVPSTASSSTSSKRRVTPPNSSSDDSSGGSSSSSSSSDSSSSYSSSSSSS